MNATPRTVRLARAPWRRFRWEASVRLTESASLVAVARTRRGALRDLRRRAPKRLEGALHA